MPRCSEERCLQTHGGAVSLSKSSFRPSQGDCQSSLLSIIRCQFKSYYFTVLEKTYRYAQGKKKKVLEMKYFFL